MTVISIQPRKRRHIAVKAQLFTRDRLDQRRGSVKAFNDLVAEVERDLGGAAALSRIERELIELFAAACISVRLLDARIAQGEPVDFAALSTIGGLAVKVAARLGLRKRTAADATPSLTDYLAARPQEAAS